MRLRYVVTGVRKKDNKRVEFAKTFSYEKAMSILVFYRTNYSDVYSIPSVEFPFWSIN